MLLFVAGTMRTVELIVERLEPLDEGLREGLEVIEEHLRFIDLLLELINGDLALHLLCAPIA